MLHALARGGGKRGGGIMGGRRGSMVKSSQKGGGKRERCGMRKEGRRKGKGEGEGGFTTLEPLRGEKDKSCSRLFGDRQIKRGRGLI